MTDDPVQAVFAPFKPAATPLPNTGDPEVTNAPKGKRGRKTKGPTDTHTSSGTPRAPRTKATDAPVPEKSPVQQTVIMVDAVTLLTAIQHLDQEATGVFMSALGAFQTLKPTQRSQIAHALSRLFP